MRTFKQIIGKSSQYKLNSEDPNSNCELSFWPIFESLTKLLAALESPGQKSGSPLPRCSRKHLYYNDLQELEATWTILKTYDWDDR